MAAAAGLIATTSTADAFGSLFWPDADVGYYYDEPAQPQPQKRRAKTYPTIDRKLEQQHKQSAKPQGPLVISVSIERQSLKVFDANGLFAETPVSTGMRGHSTPMGVFSIIQKNKFHRSNLYSGAPMPYMQRITWSGVALHAGALPGYPASHGCIRMPMSFAMKLWGWTRMGARVVIAPGEVAPEPFSHAMLVAQKPVPTQAAAVAEPDPGSSETTGSANAPSRDLNLRPALPADGVQATPDEPRTQIRTADAGRLTSSTPIASDAGAPERIEQQQPAAALTSDEAAPAKEAARPDPKSADAKPADVKPADNKSADANSSDPKSAEAKPTEAKPTEAKASDGKASDGKTSDGKTSDGNASAEPAPKAASGNDEPPKPETALAPKRSGQIAAFISGKDARLYVRQDFAPLFDVPVEITSSDRPLGTHVFTAKLDKDNSNAVSWSVVSMPTAARGAEPIDDSRATRRRKAAEAHDAQAKPRPNNAAEALDRLKIPPEAMARIAAELTTGASLIISDLGIASGETGAGTGFIIPLR
jgi:lipoprotein-anchoring transpeptidase ErfK/SrfK